MEDIIIHFLILMLLNIVCLAIVGRKKAIPQSRDIVELLDHGVHVANCSQVLDSTVAISASSI